MSRDRETVLLLLAREERGLERLLDDHGAIVLAGLRRAFGPGVPDVDLEEYVSTALFRVWCSADRFDPDRGTLRAWFFTIARNAALDGFRKAARQVGQLMKNGALDELPTETNGRPASPALLQAVRDAIALLTPRERAIVQADLASATVADASELAARLGTSENVIYVTRSRARKRLRSLLGHLAEPRAAESEAEDGSPRTEIGTDDSRPPKGGVA